MPGTLTIKTTDMARSGGQLTSLRCRYFWSVWLDGRLLAKGYDFTRENAGTVAMIKVTDLLTPDEVGHVEVIDGRGTQRVRSAVNGTVIGGNAESVNEIKR